MTIFIPAGLLLIVIVVSVYIATVGYMRLETDRMVLGALLFIIAATMYCFAVGVPSIYTDVAFKWNNHTELKTDNSYYFTPDSIRVQVLDDSVWHDIKNLKR